jgi:glycosyltransferase involved in cell wall biosynthesis
VTAAVSIVIPTFNRAPLVSRAIDSSLAQTVPVEVVVCDHGSTDDTPAVAARYGARIRYIRREQDQGPIVCWRDGIENSSGDFIHINYDDDWIDATFVEKTLPMLRPEVGFVYTRTRIHEPGNVQTKVLLRHPAGIRSVSQIVQFLLREKLPISPGCALFRKRDALKNLLLEVPGAQGRYGKNSGVGEDLLLFLLTTLDYPLYGHLPEALSHFLAHPASITTQAGSTGRMDALAQAYQRAKNYYLQRPGSLAMARGISGRLAKARWQLAGHLHL